MSSVWKSVRSRVRQLGYPSELRIVAPAVDRATDAVVAALFALSEKLRETPEPLGPEPAAPAVPSEAPEAAPATPPGLALGICNAYFRLRSNLALIAEQGQDSKELRSMKRAVDALEDTFKAAGIECRDLTEQRYDPGRLDFEQIGSAEVVAGLTHEIIGRCERPAVFLDGKLIQKAKGLVHRPASAQGELE